MALRIQIAKFELCQYLLRANSPNLMLAKVSRYTVFTSPPWHIQNEVVLSQG